MHDHYLTRALEEAFHCMRNNLGGPFGAVIVRDGKIIGKGCNQVTSTHDPTAHAEIVAIREACRAAQSYHLPGAVMYASCEPCPMCLAAIYWAGIRTVYYSTDREDARRMGFADGFIYEELGRPATERTIGMHRLETPLAEELMEEWENKKDRILY
ncbi:MAG: nucleoside deaminase [Syntrophales bacterium]|jgi:tRNA(Arg) A34 adenosine deaminase TadA|nr:nucleoside deaminase [Syntrophales bacterium]